MISNKWFLILLITSTIPFFSLSAQSEVDSLQEEAFHFNHNVGRIYSIPTADVMQSLDLSLLIGGEFGLESNQNFLGTVVFGLGDYGDLQLSTSSLLGSIFKKTESIGNIGMKIKILSNGPSQPGIAIGIRTHNNWVTENNYGTAIPTYLFDSGLRGLSYDTRITTLYIVFSTKAVDKFYAHIGAGYSDLRFKNVQTSFTGFYYQIDDQQKENIFSGFAGIEYELNERTKFLIELQTLPYLDVKIDDGNLKAKQRVIGSAGIRFFINKWLLLDTGIRYQDNYKGIADAEMKINLNGIWNVDFRTKK